MNTRLLLTFILMCIVFPVAAETEGFTETCGKDTCSWRRPIVDPPPGWVKDEESGAHFKFNAFVRKGESFSDSDAVMYALAVFKKNAEPTLAEHIRKNTELRLKGSPGAATPKPQLTRNADGKQLTTLTMTPAKATGDWETIAFDEEGDYYLVFALSARSKAAHDKARDALTALVRNYSKNPKKP